MLAYLPPQESDAMLATMELNRLTPKTIVALPKLRQELKKIRESGYALDNEENTAGVRCVAAPVFDRNGAIAAALSLTGPAQQLTEERVPKVAEMVKDAARQMTSMLGGALSTASRKNF